MPRVDVAVAVAVAVVEEKEEGHDPACDPDSDDVASDGAAAHNANPTAQTATKIRSLNDGIPRIVGKSLECLLPLETTKLRGGGASHCRRHCFGLTLTG